MKRKRIEEGRLSDRGEGLGTVTEKMVRERASQIAVVNGRGKNNILESDVTQARRELQGDERQNPTPTPAEQVPEDERWDPEGGTRGRHAKSVPAPDEQTFAEKLVDEGVADAEHDQSIEATRDDLRRNRKM